MTLTENDLNDLSIKLLRTCKCKDLNLFHLFIFTPKQILNFFSLKISVKGQQMVGSTKCLL